MFIDTKKQTLDACGDHGIRDFVSKNANEILALPTPHLERDFQLEQPIKPLNDMNITNLRDFTTKMLKTINGGKKIHRYTTTNQPSWWDNSISLWTDGMQKNGKSLGKQQYRHHIRNCYLHYNIVIESDEINVDREDNMVHTNNAVREPLVQAIDSSEEAENDNAIQEPQSIDSNISSVVASASCSDALDPSNANSGVGEETMSPIISRRPQRSHVLPQLTSVAPDNSPDGLHATDIDMPEIHDCVKATYNVVHFRDF